MVLSPPFVQIPVTIIVHFDSPLAKQLHQHTNNSKGKQPYTIYHASVGANLGPGHDLILSSALGSDQGVVLYRMLIPSNVWYNNIIHLTTFVVNPVHKSSCHSPMTAYTLCGIKLEEEEGLFDCITYNLSLITTTIIIRVNDIISKLVLYVQYIELI